MAFRQTSLIFLHLFSLRLEAGDHAPPVDCANSTLVCVSNTCISVSNTYVAAPNTPMDVSQHSCVCVQHSCGCVQHSQRLPACPEAGPADSHMQGYLAHKKQPPRRTLQKPYVQGPMVVLGVGVSYERGTHVMPDGSNSHFIEMCSGSETGSYLRPIDSCITQLKAQRLLRTYNESKKEDSRLGTFQTS